jgi:hypothetical protein
LNQAPEQLSTRQKLEKDDSVKLLAYRLWLVRRGSNISGDPDSDYYRAEQMLESYKSLQRLLLGSFGLSTVAFVLGRSSEEDYANAVDAVIGLSEVELADKYDFHSELCERLPETIRN